MYKIILLLLLFVTPLLSFPELQNNPHNMNIKYETVDIELKVINGTLNQKFTTPLYPSISAISDSFVIRSFYTTDQKPPYHFKNIKLYPSAKNYEIVISYKGVNYFRKITKKELENLKILEFKVYEQGNKKDNIKIKKMDYIIENNQFRKELIVTQDVVIKNSGNFTYNPNLSIDKLKIQLPEGVDQIVPRFNLTRGNYSIENGFLIFNTFLKPGDNFFTFAYLMNVDQYPFMLRTKSQNNIDELRVIMSNSRTRVKTNFISKLSIKELKDRTIKIGVKKNILKNKDLRLTILGKPNFKTGMIVSNIDRYHKVKKVEHHIILGSLLFLFIGVIFIFIFVKREEKNV